MTRNFGSPDAYCYITPNQMMNGCKSLIQEHPVVSTKDASDQDDWKAGKKFSASAGGIQVVGGGPTVPKDK